MIILSLVEFNCCLITKGNLREESCEKQYVCGRNHLKFLQTFSKIFAAPESKDFIEPGEVMNQFKKVRMLLKKIIQTSIMFFYVHTYYIHTYIHT